MALAGFDEALRALKRGDKVMVTHPKPDMITDRVRYGLLGGGRSPRRPGSSWRRYCAPWRTDCSAASLKPSFWRSRPMTESGTYRPIDIAGRDSGVAPAEDFGAAPSLEWIPVERLVLDDSYQRDLLKSSWTAIRKIAENFSWSRFQPIVVSPVEGGVFAVVDGQHRAHAAALCGIEAVPAMSCHLTRAEQASAFSWINGNTTKITQFHVYKAALAAGERWALDSNQAVEAADCRLMTYVKTSAQKKPGEIFCIGEIRKWVTSARGSVVAHGLYALRHGPEHEEVHLYTANVIGSWLDVVAEKGMQESPDVLKAFLSEVSIVDLLRRVEILRTQDDYRGQTIRALTRRAISATLSKFLRDRKVIA